TLPGVKYDLNALAIDPTSPFSSESANIARFPQLHPNVLCFLYGEEEPLSLRAKRHERFGSILTDFAGICPFLSLEPCDAHRIRLVRLFFLYDDKPNQRIWYQ